MAKTPERPRVVDGIRYSRGSDGLVRADRPKPVCDFCLTPADENSIRWAYPCAWVELPDNPFADASDDEWLACDDCHKLVEDDDMDGLLARNMRTRMRYADYNDPLVDLPGSLRLLRDTLERFKLARRGPAIRFRFEC